MEISSAKIKAINIATTEDCAADMQSKKDDELIP